MINTRENDKKWIETLQERNRVLEELLAFTQIENKELTKQLILSSVGSTLPKKFSAAAYTQAITGNYEEFVKWWDER